LTRSLCEDGSAVAADCRESMHESPRIRRLRNDLTALERLRSESSVFDFQASGNPPYHYLIILKGKGLCRDRGKVKIVHYHRVEIKLGASYPRTIPELRWLTSVYHPNISEIGMVCLGGYGTHWVPSVQLDELCMMLWDMARYFNYDIRSPYNRDAALWVANQTSILFPTDSRPLRDLRAAQGRVEASNEKFNRKSTGPVGDSSGRSKRAGRPSPEASGTRWDGRSPLSRVRQFMERYARAIGEEMAPQPELGATLIGPEPSTTAGPEPLTTPLDASSVSASGENEPGNVVLNTPIGEANGHLGEDERDGVVILEATNDVPVRPARRSEADDEIVFIE
jgi:ubiquitin-protein ligase